MVCKDSQGHALSFSLTSPVFAQALERVLESGTPILGVMKGAAPAGALPQALGLSEEYILAADRLRRQLSQSEDTLLYCLGDQGVNVLAEGSFHAETVNLMSRNLAVLPSRRSAVSGRSVVGDIAVPRLCGI